MAESKIQDLEPVEQIQDTDNIPLENGGKAKRITGSKLIRYLIQAADHLGLLGIHVGSDQPSETQNVWFEEVDEYTIPDDAYASWDIRYEKLGLLNDKITSAVKGWSSKKISDLLSKKADTTAIPNVPSWAMQPKKPSYTASEVGALPAGTKIPSKTSDLTNDSGYTTVDEAQKVYNGLYAKALTRTVWGEVIAVDDVSPLDHEVGCKVERINLADIVKPNNGDGLTWTVESGELILNGIPEKSNSFYTIANFHVQPGDYFCSLNIPGGGSDYQGLMYKKSGNIYAIEEGKATVLNSQEDAVTMTFVVKKAGYEFKNLRIKPQLVRGRSSIPYDPYIPDLSKVTVTRQRADGTDAQNYNPNADGVVSGMTSLNPNMTILTDTPGAIVELTYNQDPTVVIKKLTDRVSELENTQVKEAL